MSPLGKHSRTAAVTDLSDIVHSNILNAHAWRTYCRDHFLTRLTLKFRIQEWCLNDVYFFLARFFALECTLRRHWPIIFLHRSKRKTIFLPCWKSGRRLVDNRQGNIKKNVNKFLYMGITSLSSMQERVQTSLASAARYHCKTLSFVSTICTQPIEWRKTEFRRALKGFLTEKCL